MLRVEQLNYSFGTHPVLTDVSFALRSRAIALLGPNGAGKTTFLQLLATEKFPSAGAIEVDGLDPARRLDRRRYRAGLGYLPQSFEMYPDYTCAEFVRFVGWLRRVPTHELGHAVDGALSAVHLHAQRDTRIRKLSGGMRQRLGLAQAIVNRPATLLMDEPTVGLDPLERRDFRQRIVEFSASTRVVLSTHLVEDVVDIADTVVVLVAGRVRFAGSLTDFCDSPEPTGADLEHAYARHVG